MRDKSDAYYLEKLAEPVYLGDAVEASHDGYQVKLHTLDGNNQVIYLDDRVCCALKIYFKHIEAILEAQANRLDMSKRERHEPHSGLSIEE